MEEQHGTIQISGVKPNKSLLRYVQRQLQKWISREKPALSVSNDTDYIIAIEREIPGMSLYGCSIDIRIGSQYWASREDGKTIQEALARAIRHLRPISVAMPRGVPEARSQAAIA